MKYYTSGILSLIMLVFLFNSDGCGQTESTDKEQAAQTEELLSEANRQVGMPNIVNFQERKLAKMILELRDSEDLLTYTYIVNFDGDLIFLGRSVGYGLPYAVQFTNPIRTIRSLINGGGVEQLPQADPNGLFMPDALSATWVMLIDPNTNEPRPVYVEPQIIVSPIKLH